MLPSSTPSGVARLCTASSAHIGSLARLNLPPRWHRRRHRSSARPRRSGGTPRPPRAPPAPHACAELAPLATTDTSSDVDSASRGDAAGTPPTLLKGATVDGPQRAECRRVLSCWVLRRGGARHLGVGRRCAVRGPAHPRASDALGHRVERSRRPWPDRDSGPSSRTGWSSGPAEGTRALVRQPGPPGPGPSPRQTDP